MGHLRAEEAATIMTDKFGLNAALEYHLTSNHYPPVPRSMIPVARRAIELATASYWSEDGDLMNEPIDLPDGITTASGAGALPAWEVIRSLHLETFAEAAITDPVTLEEE